MNIELVLNDLGLNKNKSSVYLALLALGTSTSESIAKSANLKRTTVHEILQTLVSRGLVSFITKKRTRLYTPEPPEKLRTILREQERHVEAIMPELKSMQNTAGARPQVRFYSGLEGVKTVFEDTLTVKNKILYGILSMEDLYKIPGRDYMDDYVERRVKAGIKLKVIRSETKDVEEVWTASHSENRELHYAPSNMVFPMTIYMYDGKVAIISTQKENFGMIIESRDYYNTQMNLFNVMWEVTRVAKPKD